MTLKGLQEVFALSKGQSYNILTHIILINSRDLLFVMCSPPECMDVSIFSTECWMRSSGEVLVSCFHDFTS